MSRIINIKNKWLSVDIDCFGAELKSVKNTRNQCEYIWQADTAIWPRHAPILFPIVGRLKNHKYTFNGEVYTLNQHGFARDSEFIALQQSEHSASFLLQQDDASLKQYPFRFEFIMTYTLEGTSLKQSFTVKNNGIEVMPVSFGGHPAFNVQSIDGCKIQFGSDETSLANLLFENATIGTHQVACIQDGFLDLTTTTFDKDALIFLNLTSSEITLLDQENNKVVSIEFSEFPYLGIWSKPGAPFVCLEPWQGIADVHSHSGELEKKVGLLWLSQQKHVTKTFTMTFH